MKKLFLALTLLSATFFYAQKIEAIEKDSILSILFIGDLMGHKDQINAAYDKLTNTYNYQESFIHIKDDLNNADVTIGNLEVTLGTKPYSGYPEFSSPAQYAKDIKLSGVDILMTSNNHSCDKKKRGIEKTIHILDSLKIKHTGTFISAKEKEKKSPLIINKKGFKIAILNYTYGTNGIKPTHPNIVNYLKKETILKDIKKAKQANPDQIIAFVHWGKEYKNHPNNYQKKWFKFFKKNDINIVIGAHPHVVQPMLHNKKENSIVAYSLGNFISHQRTFPRDGGAILKLELKKKKDSIIINNAEHKLTWVYEPLKYGVKKYFVLPISEFEKKPKFFTKHKDYTKMMRFAKHARTLLNKENLNIKEY